MPQSSQGSVDPLALMPKEVREAQEKTDLFEKMYEAAMEGDKKKAVKVKGEWEGTFGRLA